MKNEGYISNTQNLLSNETSRKMAKEVSWKYHKFASMYHKITSIHRKNTSINRKNTEKQQKIHRFRAINTLFSRYNRNFY